MKQNKPLEIEFSRVVLVFLIRMLNLPFQSLVLYCRVHVLMFTYVSCSANLFRCAIYVENKYNLPTDNIEYTQHVLTKAQEARLQSLLKFAVTPELAVCSVHTVS